jgi:hypothetical protein
MSLPQKPQKQEWITFLRNLQNISLEKISWREHRAFLLADETIFDANT